MKKLIERIQKYFLHRKISKMMIPFLWELNSRETRDQIRFRLSKMVGTELRDNTDADMVQSGCMSFSGYSVKRKKEINIMIGTRDKK